ncbi:MAG: hypothetical protein LBR54_01955 [Oscillospiraceae bacterium]|jgi:thymidine kinase|nr:hypothetical protein [Oscillospiraceae bacterium]
MIKLITGTKGSGKTKILVSMINKSLKTATGDLVCIEKNANLTYDISYKVRLVEASRFSIDSYESFYGFIAGMLAGNHDIKEIYVDSILDIAGGDLVLIGSMLEKLDIICGEDVTMVFTLLDNGNLPETVKKYEIVE